MSNNNNNNNNNDDLRKKITNIQKDSSLDPKEKARKIQMVISGKWFETRPVITEPTIESDYATTYNDEANGVCGCSHYQRNCKLKAACCGHIFTCRFCHDDKSDHQINRFATEEVLCLHCKTLQPVSGTCKNAGCGITFARYFCEYCKFYDDDPNKQIYHCPHCKLCRLGQGLGIDFQHCIKCNACLSIIDFDNHKCMENKFGSNCPICSQNMFHSTQPLSTLKCGHGIHLSCLQKYERTSFKCPLCSKRNG